MSHMSELAECREAFRSQPEPSIWQRAQQGGSVPVVEETPSLGELFDRPGKATRDWYEVIGVAASMELWPPGWAEDRLEALAKPEIVDLSNDPLIMGILAGDIRTLCLDCSERDCPAHPVNGVV